MVSFKQTGFGGGLIGPQLRGKTNQEKYQAGLKECLNWVITRFGSAENRAGTQFIGEIKDSSAKVREVPFIFNANISYDLEFGNLYLRVWRQGARVSVVGAAAYVGGTTYAIGDLVTYGGAVYWSMQDANIGHTPDVSPTFWYLQAGGFLEIPTNIAQAALSSFQYVQQNDVMTISHQSVTPQQLIRHSDTEWAWQAFTQSAGIAAPTNVAAVAGVSPGAVPGPVTGVTAIGGNGALPANLYLVTAWQTTAPVSEGEASGGATSTVGGADAANPVALAWTAVAGATGYAIYRYRPTSNTYNIIGISNTNAFSDNGIRAALPVKTANTASLSSNATLYTYVVTAIDGTSGAESLASSEATCSGQTPTSTFPNVITWDAVAGASRYNVYSVVNGVPGFIGSIPGTSFNDDNISPSTTIQPPTQLDLFATPDDYPAVVGYYQQRLTFANSINDPQTVEASNVGSYSNFSTAVPVTDDSAVQFTIAGKQVQEVRALIDLGKLIIHTSGDEYVAGGNQAGALTPTGIGLVHQGSAGCSTIPPIVIGNVGIFVQARGSVLRDLEYSIYTTSFKGRDLTVFAPHLFVGRTIVDMAWQQIPNSIIWCVMSDGALLGLTYNKDHDEWAWHRHDTDGGLFENVVVVPEGSEDVVYFVVKRTINGSVKRYIERLYSRDYTTIIDAKFVDCGLTYDGRNTGFTTMTATTSGGWTPQDNLTMTASAPYFALADVGNAIVFQEIDSATGEVTDTCTFDIIAYTGTTAVTVQPERVVPAWAKVALTTWGKAVHQFSGIDHLEGETIAGLGDGNVIPQTTVVSGSFTTEDNFMVLTVGLPITADLETLPIENQQGETIANKKVVVTELTPIFYESRGGQYGQDFDHLKEWIQRQGENLSEPTRLYTGPRRLPITGTWQLTGQVAIRQSDPLPIGISALVPTGSIGN